MQNMLYYFIGIKTFQNNWKKMVWKFQIKSFKSSIPNLHCFLWSDAVVQTTTLNTQWAMLSLLCVLYYARSTRYVDEGHSHKKLKWSHAVADEKLHYCDFYYFLLVPRTSLPKNIEFSLNLAKKHLIESISP